VGRNQRLPAEERLEIIEALKRGNLSHQEIAKRFKRAQSTVSSIARDAGITPTHRRRRTPAARDVEGTFNQEERINFVDRFIGVLDGMISGGGLTPREAREVSQAAKVALDARRSEDLPDEGDEQGQRFEPLEGMGDMAIDPNSRIGREMKKLEEELGRSEASEEE
jgi:transposase-like protein